MLNTTLYDTGLREEALAPELPETAESGTSIAVTPIPGMGTE